MPAAPLVNTQDKTQSLLSISESCWPIISANLYIICRLCSLFVKIDSKCSEIIQIYLNGFNL